MSFVPCRSEWNTAVAAAQWICFGAHVILWCCGRVDRHLHLARVDVDSVDQQRSRSDRRRKVACRSHCWR